MENLRKNDDSNVNVVMVPVDNSRLNNFLSDESWLTLTAERIKKLYQGGYNPDLQNLNISNERCLD